jgi:predicted transposase/invertase (TIGR01784 family)
MSGKTPHDNLFRLAFSQVPYATAHFQATLPAAVVEAVRWETLALQPGSFVDPELQHLQSDVLYRAQLAGEGEACLYVLFEHQARPDALMPFRLLRYMVRIWERWLEQTKNQRPLPFIVPMVLYNGDRSWNVSLAFEDLLPESLRAELLPFIPAFVYALQDLSVTLDEDLRGEPFRELVLLWLKYAKERDFWQRLPAWLPSMQQVDRVRELEPLMRYLFYATPQPMPEEIRLLLTTELTHEVERWWMSWAQQLEESVREEALQQGRQQGLEQGRQERQRLLDKLRRQLLRAMEAQFGPLPEQATQRVEAASEEELDTFSERLASARSIDELLR